MKNVQHQTWLYLTTIPLNIIYNHIGLHLAWTHIMLNYFWCYFIVKKNLRSIVRKIHCIYRRILVVQHLLSSFLIYFIIIYTWCCVMISEIAMMYNVLELVNKCRLIFLFSVPKAVAFQVDLEGQETENLILKHPPIKLKVWASPYSFNQSFDLSEGHR